MLTYPNLPENIATYRKLLIIVHRFLLTVRADQGLIPLSKHKHTGDTDMEYHEALTQRITTAQLRRRNTERE
jgi:hypothetical protein